MATLTGKTIAATYTSLLKLEGDSGSTVAGASGNAVQVKTGDDDATPLYLNTDRVGIGTAAPDEHLHLNNASGDDALIRFTNSTTGSGSTDGAKIGLDAGSGLFSFYNFESIGFAWYTANSGTAKMTMLSSGDVGIGTTVPSKRLTVSDTADNAQVNCIFVYNDDHADTETGQAAAIVGGVKAKDGNFVSSGEIVFGKDDDFDDTASKDGHIAFHTRSGNTMSSTTPRMIIKHDGNVGIGITTPEASLDVGVGNSSWVYATANAMFHEGIVLARAGDAQTYNAPVCLFRRSYSGDEGDYSDLNDDVAADHTLGNLIFQGYRGGWEEAARIAVDVNSAGSGYLAGRMEFHVTDTGGTLRQAMTILSAGADDQRVGIGTAAPDHILHVEVSSGEQEVRVTSDSLADTENSKILMEGKKSGGSSRFAGAGVVYNDAVAQAAGYLRCDAHDGVAAYIYLDEDDDLQVSNVATHIGTTSGQELHDDITASDERLKEISPDAFPYGLSTINSLSPIKFRYKYKIKNDWKLGLGAQTTQPIVPETVIDTDLNVEGLAEGETKLRMSYSQFIPILIKAVQELSAKVTALENA